MLIIYLFNYEINTQIETFPEVINQPSGMNGSLELKIKNNFRTNGTNIR